MACYSIDQIAKVQAPRGAADHRLLPTGLAVGGAEKRNLSRIPFICQLCIELVTDFVQRFNLDS